MVRRVLAPFGVALVALFHVLSGGCSSSSSLAGGGGCDAFCTKWIGAHCRNGPTMEACLATCHDEQDRCTPEANAVLKCATIEAQIACETSSGEPRIVGCVPRETALSNCIACDRFCETWIACPQGPTREECLATCLDPRCAEAHRSLVDCMPSGAGVCGPTGPTAPAVCMSSYRRAQACTSLYGQEQPFRWLPVQALPGDSGPDG